jgi:hypothetical protein
MSYFLIISGEDGLTAKGPLTKEQLLKEIDPENWGSSILNFQSKLETRDGYLTGTVYHADSNNLAVIIKGEIIIPKVKEVIKTYDIP